jgi:hypothetical protein
MNWRDIILMAWAIERGGLTRVVALVMIVAFVGFWAILFLAAIGGPGEIIRYLQHPAR